MTTGTEPRGAGDAEAGATSLVDALLVYAEPLASGAHTVVIGDADSPIADRLLDLGARGVHVFDPDPARAADAARNAPRGVTVRALTAELDVRDGAFDLAVIPDLAYLEDARTTIARLRRAVAGSGAVIAMSRARLADAAPGGGDEVASFASELGPSTLEYGELYDLFATEFEDVALVGVVPFRGVVFAELGTEDEAPAVSVDTRLASSDPPSVFLVVASGTDHRGVSRAALDPYAIVQVPEDEEVLPREATIALEAAFAAAQLKSELLLAQIEELLERIGGADAHLLDAAARLDRAALERDAALTRAMELEAVLSASQQTMASVERRLLEAEQGCLERDDRIARLSAELDARRSAEVPLVANAALVEELGTRAERAEVALASTVADLAHIADAHGAETAAFEAQLTDRARFIAALEKELVRREKLVKELVTSLEETRENPTSGPVFEATAPLSLPAPRASADPALIEENARLRRKLDELAGEVARREGELTARAWRITELQNERVQRANASGNEAQAKPEGRKATSSDKDADGALTRARHELDALRQAFAQEHAARVAAESGEELAHARAELARQAALLEQMRGRSQSS